MTREDAGDQGDPIQGLPLEEAVDVAVEADESRERADVRATLEEVTRDNVVHGAVIDAIFGMDAQVLGPAARRVDGAEDALAEAHEAAEPVSDLAVVRSRLDAYAERFEAIRTELERLEDDLDGLHEQWRDGAAIYETAAGIRALREEATRLLNRAVDLTMDVEAFERWLGDPALRFDELSTDAEAMAGTVEDLSSTVDAIGAAVEDDDPAAGVANDPATAWIDVTLRQRVLSLFVADLRAELSDLTRWGQWPDVEDTDAQLEDRASELDERVSGLEERCEGLGDRLSDLARPDWRERFGDDLAAFEAELEGFDPPVQWEAVQETLDAHRSEVVTTER